MLQRHVGPGGQHSRTHKLIGGVGLLAPENQRQGVKPQCLKFTLNPGLIGKKLKFVIDCSGCITNIDTGKSAFFHHPPQLAPNPVQDLVHRFKCTAIITAGNASFDSGIHPAKLFVPHGDHWIGR